MQGVARTEMGVTSDQDCIDVFVILAEKHAPTARH